MRSTRWGITTLEIVQGDITKQAVDAIVNAANEMLVGGGGVDGAIHRAGGPSIMAECDKIRSAQGGCPTGTAVITTAGKLLAKNVIHTVGPIWNENSPDECDRLLQNAYRSSIDLAVYHGLRTIAFPSISTGVYGFPIHRAAPLVMETIHFHLMMKTPPLEEIRFVLFSERDVNVYEETLRDFVTSKEEEDDDTIDS
jgi:O-acetyl-ADP-ribose deacetylase (regulator of RNase III)